MTVSKGVLVVLALACCVALVYPKCKDVRKESTCKGWLGLCKQQMYKRFMTNNCKKTCNLCTGPWKPQCSGCKNAGNSDSDVAVACLRAHNAERQKHAGTADLVWDAKLADGALYWARKNAADNSMHHSDTIYGENLYTANTSSGTPSVSCEAVVKAWYSEIKDWNFAKSASNGGVTGHFTQVVWKGTQKVGMGFATNGNSLYVAARYAEGGNMKGGYAANVGNLKAAGDELIDDIEFGPEIENMEDLTPSDANEFEIDDEEAVNTWLSYFN